MKEPDFVLLDFGALYRRYRSDISRTFFNGHPTNEMKEMYHIVHEAQARSLEQIRAGINGKDVHNIASEYIDSTRLRGKFIHSLGHSIGLSTHDGGVLHSKIDLELKEGMVFTVEPGVYVPGLGGVRIEDNIIITKNGYEMLTSAPKEFEDICII